MPLGQSLQGAPAWWNDYIQELIAKSRQHAAEPYAPYGQLSPEKKEALKSQIDQLIQQQNGVESDIIPFSITGTSKAINVNPEDLKAITENEEFARKVYSSATGHQNISRDEIEDLRNRASQQLQPHLREIEINQKNREREQLERQARAPELEARHNSLHDRLAQIRGQAGEIGRIMSPIEQRLREIDSRKSPIEQRLREIDSRKSEIENQLVQSNLIQRPQHLLSNSPFIQRQRDSSIGQLAREQNNPLAISYMNLKNEGEPLRQDLSRISAERQPLSLEIERLTAQRLPIMEENKRLLAEQKQVSRELHPELYERNNAVARRSAPEDFLKRASIEREIKKLQEEQGNPRIAPMNEYHERAINMLERSFNDDTLKLSADELREAKKHSERDAVEPLMKASLEGPSDEYMNKYVNDYTKDIRKALQDASEEEYIKKIAPKINLSFAQMGAFHSGARAKALKDSLLEHRTKLHRELAHLTSSARDKAMEHHELQKRREQSAANLMGNTVKSEREAARQGAELLRNNAVTKHGISQMNIAALGQVAKAKQEQAQNEINVSMQEHEKKLLHPQEQRAREAAFVSGLPAPAVQSIGGQLSAPPVSPNLFNLGAGTLAALTAGIGENTQRRKEGGSVRKKYADGGPIGSGDIGNEIRNIIREQGQADQTRLTEAREHNPLQSWLKHVGREMLSKPSENPLYNLSRGTANSMDHGDIMRERAHNLYDKIQSTKLNQYQVLAAYENMKSKDALERERLSETKRVHDMMHQMSTEKLNDQLSKKINAQPAAHKKTSTEKKLEDKALENIIENYEMKNDLVLMENAIKNSTLGTGPWVGVGKSFLGIDNDIDVLGNHIVTKANKLYGRGAGSNLQLKTLQGGKPGQNLSKKANETIIKKYGQESDRRINKNVSYLLKSGWSPEEIGTATGIEMPRSSLGGLEPQINTEDKQNKNNIVKMADPDGKPLDVPEDQVDKALELGAILVH